jgi:hypothetical protein
MKATMKSKWRRRKVWRLSKMKRGVSAACHQSKRRNGAKTIFEREKECAIKPAAERKRAEETLAAKIIAVAWQMAAATARNGGISVTAENNLLAKPQRRLIGNRESGGA